MKRTLSILIAFLLVLTALPVGASALAAPELRVTCDYDAAQSCILRVTAWLDNCQGLAAGAFELTWSGDDLRFIKGEPGSNGGMAAVDAVGNTVGHSVAFPGVCNETGIELFTVTFGVKRACSVDFSLAVSDRQISGVKIPKAVSLRADLVRPEGGMPYYITSLNGDGTLTLNGMITDRSAVTLPAEIDGRRLTAIGVGAFENLQELKSIVLPEGIVSVGANAFSGCEWLKKVSLPAHLESIGAHAFSGCRSLREAQIPASVTSVGSGAFRGCASLEDAVLPEGLDYLGDKVFSGCASQKTAALGGVSYVSVGLFSGCIALEKVELPQQVTSVGEYAFENCRALARIDLPEGLRSIGEYAFCGCASLKEIEFPETLSSLGAKALEGCVSLENIRVAPQNLYYSDVDGKALYTANRRELILLAPGAGLREFTAAASTEMIDAGAFAYNKTVEKIDLPAGIVDIGADAFFGCSALSEITASGKNCYVKDGALYTAYPDFTGNVRVTLECLPAACGVKEFTLPADVSAIAPHALTGALSVEKFSVAQENKSFKTDSSGALYDFDKTELIAYPPASDKTEYSLPNNVRTVRADAFYGSGNLTAINSKSMYYKDKDGVLLTGDKLTLAAYPGGLAAEEYALPANIAYIADGAFSGVKTIGTLRVPASVISVGEGSFYDAELSVAYDGSRGAWESIEIGRRNDPIAFGEIKFAETETEPEDLVPAHPDPEYLPGDVNGDGKVTSADARLALRAAAKLEELDETQKQAADVNGDGRIASADARTILRVAAKLEVIEPIADS